MVFVAVLAVVFAEPAPKPVPKPVAKPDLIAAVASPLAYSYSTVVKSEPLVYSAPVAYAAPGVWDTIPYLL